NGPAEPNRPAAVRRTGGHAAKKRVITPRNPLASFVRCRCGDCKQQRSLGSDKVCHFMNSCAVNVRSQCVRKYRLLMAVSVALRQRVKAVVMLSRTTDTPRFERAVRVSREANRHWLAARSAYEAHKRVHNC